MGNVLFINWVKYGSYLIQRNKFTAIVLKQHYGKNSAKAIVSAARQTGL